MRDRVKTLANKIGLYPVWLIIRYFLIEYSYERRRGKQISQGLLEEYAWLKEYKNKYDGKRCFIICNGPSLTQDDYVKLKDEYTFGMNLIFNWFEETGIETDILAIQDYFSRAKEIEADLNRIKSSKIVISDHIVKKYGFKTSCTHYLVPGSMWNVHFPHCLNRVMINDNHLGFAIGKSVAFLCLELAFYMGFKKIYLVGADCTFSGGINNMHAVGLNGQEIEAKNVKKQEYILKNKEKIYKKIISDYKIVQRYANRHGITVINATRGGALEVFPRADLDQILYN